MRIIVDTDRCVGAGQCALLAPRFFDQDEDGIVTVLADRPAESARTEVSEAADLCPSAAITIHED
ncbi:ferredoxin [Amycolatopsis cihanbeyliensis]|uniref:Ferredoxin n=1 Tax=Amycolatopsis cihanbeyliensis TaxID=1128664 RepID=A0A542DBD7_AMYCI|nr:ferredoxin [Amycolatopsis cihanbeyliensis]TQJ00388.1 ferredoxin [Amycolatopsis cihanbeyliensis]